MHQILKLYENRLWLKHQYTDLQKSAYKIARECGIKVGVVYTWLRRFNIPIRSCSKAAQLRAGHVNLTKEILEFLNGGLLGDGHMQKGYSVSYSQSSKYESYVKWLSEKFIEFGIKQTGKIGKMVGTSRKGKKLTNYSYTSRRYVELIPLYAKWYRKARADEKFKSGKPKRWIKILPKDLELTPLVVRQWYIGDGSLQRKERYITLGTEGFGRAEVGRLAKMLNELGFVTKQQKNNNIRISQRSTQDFLNYVGSCPVKCFEYKWRYDKYKRRYS